MMDTTFISIHNLDHDARILYTSDSIVDLLGYTPDEVVNRSAWEFFHEDELPYARSVHQKRISQDKAAVLAYCQVKKRDGQWISCECCFTVVYDVMVVCTSIYNRSIKSQKRALEAPIVRRIFTSSPQDPRYHMLSHMSAKFREPAKTQTHEPRAALFLNRFTRTLTIMYATSGIQEIMENCLPEAIKCLENAKGNDSIAYLRFWFRDPRQDDPPPPAEDSDEDMTSDNETTDTSIDTSEGGVGLQSHSDSSQHAHSPKPGQETNAMEVDGHNRLDSRTSSGISTADTHEAIFGESLAADSSASSMAPSPEGERPVPADPIELEAVISCASDGLVVCLRKARPMIPHPTHRPSRPVYENGLFAAPWAFDPVLPPMDARPAAGFGTNFAPALGPHGAQHNHPQAQPAAGFDQADFMNAIRDQAVFSWALTGINGSLAEYSRGKPSGDAIPENGLAVWVNDDPLQITTDGGSVNGYSNGQ